MSRLSWLRLGLAWAVLPLLLPALAAEQKAAVIGRSLAPDGLMFRRSELGQPWHIVKKNEELTGGQTILGLRGAELQSKNGAVGLTFLGDINGHSPYPIRETAIVLPTKASETDLDFTFERGRLDLVNRKDKGAAKVRVLVLGEPWDLTLETPGTRIALEMFGRWPRGVPFNPNPGPKDVPTVHLISLVLKGEVQVKHDGVQRLLQAPPGLAMLQWDNSDPTNPLPQKLDKLPDWGTGENPTEEQKKLAAVLKKIHGLILTRPLDEVLDQLVKSDDPLERRFAVFAMGALDDLPRLAEALRTAKHDDVWDNGVLALRHWIGRGPGQDMTLYRGLIAKKGYTPLQAETVLTLLHSFSEEERAQIETYGLLIGYLSNDELPIRGLAHWHLKRLVDGKAVEAIGFDPLAPKEQRDKALAKWRELLKKSDMAMARLQGLGDRELAKPQTCEQLIGYLDNELLPVRVLAYGYLKQLVDEQKAKALDYNPLYPREEREKAQARWRELLKKGELPPKKGTPK